jgi:hypothetical protein
VVEGARPTVDLKTEWGGYYQEPEIVSREPFDTQGTFRHELGHFMDDKAGRARGIEGPISQSSEWREAVKRWAADPRAGYHGGDVWNYITVFHPGASEEKPQWNEAYAYGATLSSSEIPSYIRPFYSWRDWKALEETEKRAQVAAIPGLAAERFRKEELRRVTSLIARGKAYEEEPVFQSATEAGIEASDLERMWGGDYQRYPIPFTVFAYQHDRYKTPEEARADWDKIPELDRYRALEWFFDGIWPLVKDDPGDWQIEKNFLDFIGIVDTRTEKPEARRRAPGLTAPPLPVARGRAGAMLPALTLPDRLPADIDSIRSGVERLRPFEDQLTPEVRARYDSLTQRLRELEAVQPPAPPAPVREGPEAGLSPEERAAMARTPEAIAQAQAIRERVQKGKEAVEKLPGWPVQFGALERTDISRLTKARQMLQGVLSLPYNYYLKPLFQGLYELAKIPERGLYVRGVEAERLAKEPGGLGISSLSDLASTAAVMLGFPPPTEEDFKIEALRSLRRPAEEEQRPDIEQFKQAWDLGWVGYSLIGDTSQWYPDPDRGRVPTRVPITPAEEAQFITAREHAELMLGAGKSMQEVIKAHENVGVELLGNTIIDPVWLIPPAWAGKLLPVKEILGVAEKGLAKVPGLSYLIDVTKAGRVKTYGYAISDAMDRFMLQTPADQSVTERLGRLLMGDEETLATLGRHDRQLLDYAAATFKRHDSTWQAVIGKYAPEVLSGMPPAEKAAAIAHLDASLQALAERIISKVAPEEVDLVSKVLERDPRKIGRWLAEGLINLKRRELGLKIVQERGALYRGMAFAAQLWKESILPINIAFHQTNLLDSSVRMALRGYFWSPGDLPVITRILQKLTGREPLEMRVAQELEELGVTLPRELQTGLIRELLETEGYRLKTQYAYPKVPIPFIGKPGAVFDFWKKMTGNDLIVWASEASTKGGLQGKLGKLIGAVRFADTEVPILDALQGGRGYEIVAKALNRLNFASLVEAGAENLNIEPLVRITTFWKEADPLFNLGRLNVAEWIEREILASNPGTEVIAREIADQVRNPNVVQSVADLGKLLDRYVGEAGPKLDALSISFTHGGTNKVLQNIGRRVNIWAKAPTTEADLTDIFAYGQHVAEENYSKVLSSIAPEQATVEQLRLAGAPEHLTDDIARRVADADAQIRVAYKRLGAAVRRIEVVRGSDLGFYDLGRSVSSRVNQEVWAPHYEWYNKEFWPAFQAKLDHATTTHDNIAVSRLWDEFRATIGPKFVKVGENAAALVDDIARDFLRGIPTDELAKALGATADEIAEIAPKAVAPTAEAVGQTGIIAEGVSGTIGPLPGPEAIRRFGLDAEDIRILETKGQLTKRITGPEGTLAEVRYRAEIIPPTPPIAPEVARPAEGMAFPYYRVAEGISPTKATEEMVSRATENPEIQRMADILGIRTISIDELPPGRLADYNPLTRDIRIAYDVSARMEKAPVVLRGVEQQTLEEYILHEVGHGLEAELTKRGLTGAGLVRGEDFAESFKKFITDPESLPEKVERFIAEQIDAIAPEVARPAVVAPTVRVSVTSAESLQDEVKRLEAERETLRRTTEVEGPGLVERILEQEAEKVKMEDASLLERAKGLRDETVEALREMQEQALLKYRTAREIAERVPGTLAGLDEIRPQAMRQMADSYENAVAQGISTVHELFYDYVARRGMDELLWWGSPFTIWQTRNPFGWAKVISQRPVMVNVIRRTLELTRAEAEERALPGRFDGTVPLPQPFVDGLIQAGILPRDMPRGTYLAADVTQFYSIWGQVPAIEGDLPWGWEEEPLIGKIARSGEFIGMRTYPWWQIPLEKLGAYGSVPASDLTYANKFIKAITGALGKEVDTEKPLREWRDRNEQNGIARYYANLRLLDYFFNDQITMVDLVEAAGNPGNGNFQKAYQESMDWQFRLALIRGLEPFTLKYATPAEQKARQLQEQYYNLPISERAKFREDNPLLVAYWTIIRSPEEAEGNRQRQRREQWEGAVRGITAAAMTKVPLGTKAYEDLVDTRRRMLDSLDAIYRYEEAPPLLQSALRQTSYAYFNLNKGFFDEEGTIKDEALWPQFYDAREAFLRELDYEIPGEPKLPGGRLEFERYLAQNETPDDAIVRAWERIYGDKVWDVINEQAKNPDKVVANTLIAQAKPKANQGRANTQALLAEVLRIHPDWAGEKLAVASQATKRLATWDVWARRNQPLRDALVSTLWSSYMGLDNLARKRFREFIEAEPDIDPRVAIIFEEIILPKEIEKGQEVWARDMGQVSTKTLLLLVDRLGGVIDLQREGFQGEIEEAEKEYELAPISPIVTPGVPAQPVPVARGTAVAGVTPAVPKGPTSVTPSIQPIPAAAPLPGEPAYQPPTPGGAAIYGKRQYQPPPQEESIAYDQWLGVMTQFQNIKATNPEGASAFWQANAQILEDSRFYSPGSTSQFWDYYYGNIPPGRIAEEIRNDPLIQAIVSRETRDYLTDEGFGEAVRRMQAWAAAHPEIVSIGNPEEWATVREIVGQWSDLRDQGRDKEAKALWKEYGDLLNKYYPSGRGSLWGMVRGRRGGGGRWASRAPSGAWETRQYFDQIVPPLLQGSLANYWVYGTPFSDADMAALTTLYERSPMGAPTFEAWLNILRGLWQSWMGAQLFTPKLPGTYIYRPRPAQRRY